MVSARIRSDWVTLQSKRLFFSPSARGDTWAEGGRDLTKKKKRPIAEVHRFVFIDQSCSSCFLVLNKYWLCALATICCSIAIRDRPICILQHSLQLCPAGHQIWNRSILSTTQPLFFDSDLCAKVLLSSRGFPLISLLSGLIPTVVLHWLLFPSQICSCCCWAIVAAPQTQYSSYPTIFSAQRLICSLLLFGSQPVQPFSFWDRLQQFRLSHQSSSDSQICRILHAISWPSSFT